MPQGGIDAGEDPWSAAQRELYEETGVKDIEFIAKVMHEWLPQLSAFALEWQQ